MKQVQLAIVGGGPAALSAAIQAAKLGVSSIVLDENPQLGGQIYRQPASAFKAGKEKELGRHYRDGKQMLREILDFSDKIEVSNDSLVWGYFGERELAVFHNDRSELLKAQQVLIATGAYDRPVPFPGWTLPGVFTAGCIQIMIKSQRVVPGTKFLLAGSGPLQLAVADQLLKAGVQIVAVIEATSIGRMLRYLPNLLSQPSRIFEGFKYLAELKLHNVPYLQSHTIVNASGSEKVEHAVIAKIDKEWNPVRGTEQTLDVDSICLGYGLVPNTDLTRLCGCDHEYSESLGGWMPEYDDHMETSVSGIFVAGDGCGVMGVNSAIEQGRLAGVYAARNLGLTDNATAERLAEPIHKKLQNLRKFATALGELYSLKAGIFGLPVDDTLVCRCEEVSLDAIRSAIESGADNIDDIKRRTRAGMGYCQGRMCVPSIMAIAKRDMGSKPEHISFMKARSPVKPISISALLE